MQGHVTGSRRPFDVLLVEDRPFCSLVGEIKHFWLETVALPDG